MSCSRFQGFSLGKVEGFPEKSLEFFQIKGSILSHFFRSPRPRYGGVRFDDGMGWDAKILGPFGKFLSCCYAVAAGASAGCAGIIVGIWLDFPLKIPL